MDLKKWKFNFKEVNTILEIVENGGMYDISIVGTDKKISRRNPFILIDLLEDAHKETHLYEMYYLLNDGGNGLKCFLFNNSINNRYEAAYKTLMNHINELNNFLSDTPLKGAITKKAPDLHSKEKWYKELSDTEKMEFDRHFMGPNDFEMWYFWGGPDYISDKEEEVVKEVEERLLGMLNNREYKSTEIYKVLLEKKSVLYEIDGIEKFRSIVYSIVEAPECKTDEQLRKREAAVNGLAAYICKTAAKKGIPAESELCIFYSLLTYQSGFALTYRDLVAEMVKGAENKITLQNLAKDTSGKYRVIGSDT